MALPNFCKPGDMSTCTAGKKWDDHNKCYFAEKATEFNRCMYYMESIDGACDCVAAQKAEYNPIETKPMKLSSENPLTGETKRRIKIIPSAQQKTCPIDKESICAKEWCGQWNWCKTKDSL